MVGRGGRILELLGFQMRKPRSVVSCLSVQRIMNSHRQRLESSDKTVASIERTNVFAPVGTTFVFVPIGTALWLINAIPTGIKMNQGKQTDQKETWRSRIHGGDYLAHPVWRRTRAFAYPLFSFRVFILSCFRDSSNNLVPSRVLNGTRRW